MSGTLQRTAKTQIFFFIIAAWATTAGLNTSDTTAYRISGAIGCPNEDSTDLSLVTPLPAAGYFAIGQAVESKCDARGDTSWSLRTEKPKDFMVYPSTNRTCQPDGTWSSPPPFCLSKNVNTRGKLDVEPSLKRSLDHVLDGDSWIIIGDSSSCKKDPEAPNLLSYQTFHFEYKFNAHFYFSFLKLESYDTNVNNVEIYAKKASVIKEDAFSTEARAFQVQHFNEWSKIYAPVPADGDRKLHFCAVTELSVYTHELRVKYSMKRQALKGDSKDMVDTTFVAFKPQASKQRCPALPQIPNTRFLNTTVDLDIFEYACSAGHVLVDLATRKPMSNGTLSCVRGKWVPYPFFACLKFTEITYDWNKDNSTPSQNDYSISLTSWLVVLVILFFFNPIAVFVLLACFKREFLERIIQRFPRRDEYRPAPGIDPVDPGDPGDPGDPVDPEARFHL